MRTKYTPAESRLVRVSARGGASMWIPVIPIPGARLPRPIQLLVGVPCAFFIILLFGYGTLRLIRAGEWGFALVTLPLTILGVMTLLNVLRPGPQKRSTRSAPLERDPRVPPPIE